MNPLWISAPGTELWFKELNICLSSVSVQEMSHSHVVDYSYNHNHSQFPLPSMIIVLSVSYSWPGWRPRWKHLLKNEWCACGRTSRAQHIKVSTILISTLRGKGWQLRNRVCVQRELTQSGKEMCSQQQWRGQRKGNPEKGTLNTQQGDLVCFHWT